MSASERPDPQAEPRRFVIGHDDAALSAVTHRGSTPPLVPHRLPGVSTAMLWKETELLDIGDGSDHALLWSGTLVPPGGTRFFITRIDPGARIPVHTTPTVDYHVVVEGRAVVLLESGDVELQAGDVMVMRGVAHGWHNPSATTAFVCVSTMVDMASSVPVAQDAPPK
ncbi:cupin domain-containing protein [Microbacterium sp. NIBRBAC000506063]|uniref:cupin domain-containing protein n=1 Tax=Microbacterium sp. NIBRBAC000506063 TaxID=2734618 RepID=UPI001BB71ACC|nr:cupin domain-containing protein [Microbacterium sp. NIBRBAC000506063]QTV80484.1 cupin domain-containing protein [Microbacterium sp. NIBRBAC000506063]